MTTKIFSVIALLVCSLAASAIAAPRPAAQGGQGGASLTGSVSSNGGKFYISDKATHKVVEVRGTDLQKWVGKSVRVVGEVTQGTLVSPEVLVISEISQVAAGAAVGGTAAAAGVKAGMSTAAVVGVGAGATAATVGTLVATDVIGGEEAPASRR